ncbi:MAG: hypothetical protein SNJ70_05100 [Armatimonadota bacterium]
MEDVFLLNPYKGIKIVNSPNVLIRNVYGQPLKVGITVDYCCDICRIENVHWNLYFTGLDTPLTRWFRENSTAFEFGRTDWQYCTNLFSYGYNKCFRMYKAPDHPIEGEAGGGPPNGSFVTCSADACNYGVDVEDCSVFGINFTTSMFFHFQSHIEWG